jgi:hypothetical protein
LKGNKKVAGLTVRFIGEGSPLSLIKGKIYKIIAIEDDCYRIIDETDEDYLYSIKAFEEVNHE